jgi:hypothetical protein
VQKYIEKVPHELNADGYGLRKVSHVEAEEQDQTQE